jgi:hypothetical protein
LIYLRLENNQLTGSIPSSLGRCSWLQTLHVGNNSLSGTLPATLGGCPKLQWLYAHKNYLTGIIPTEFGKLRVLEDLYLHKNRLRGTIPDSLGNHAGLQFVFLYDNQLTGTIPNSLVDCTELRGVDVSLNLLTGTIPSGLTSIHSLRELVVSENRLTGPVNLSLASTLEIFSAFKNNLDGELALPVAGKLTTLLVHSNRLSCAVSGGLSAAAANFTNLAAPGNRLQSTASSDLLGERQGPSWDAAGTVPFLWVGSPWQMWRWQLWGCTFGLVVLVVIAAATGVVLQPDAQQSLNPSGLRRLAGLGGGIGARVCTRLWRFVHFEPKRGIGAAQLWCARSLLWLALPTCATLLPIFGLGAQLYACGEGFARFGTIAYLGGASAGYELGAAIAAVVFYCVAASLVLQFRMMLLEQYVDSHRELPRVTWSALVSMYVRWLALIALCSVLPLLYALCGSLPRNISGLGGDVMNLPDWLRTTLDTGMSLLLSITTSIVIPYCCRRLSHGVFGAAGNPALTSRMLQFTRLWASVLAPSIALVLIHEDCFGGWKLLWGPCKLNAPNFNIVDSFSDRGLLVTRSTVCGLELKAARCSRAVVEQLCYLLLGKLAYAAFLLPAMALVLHTAVWRRLKQVLVRRLCCHRTYLAAVDIDAEFCALLMHMEYALIFGLAIPVILPVLAVVIGMQCSTFHFARHFHIVHLVNDYRPPLHYLWVSIFLGWTLVVTIFFDNDLHGKWIVVFGTPTGVSCLLLWTKLRAVRADSSECAKRPLLSSGSAAAVLGANVMPDASGHFVVMEKSSPSDLVASLSDHSVNYS